jgi:serine/threonine-protein kinase RsbW/stage II sporulation protein AB (anti-sigma F factor)
VVATRESLNESYPAAPASVPQARRTVVAFAAGSGASTVQLEAIKLSVSEAVSNAIVHAYDGGGGEVHVMAGLAAGELWVFVADDGCGFQAPARHPGLGWGLPLIAHMADGLEIAQRAEGGTEIRMRFGIGPGPAA